MLGSGLFLGCVTLGTSLNLSTLHILIHKMGENNSAYFIGLLYRLTGILLSAQHQISAQYNILLYVDSFPTARALQPREAGYAELSPIPGGSSSQPPLPAVGHLPLTLGITLPCT